MTRTSVTSNQRYLSARTYRHGENHMHEIRPYNPRKRRVSKLDPIKSSCPEHVSKRQNHCSLVQSRPPSAFWDNLTRTYLTRSALREVDRRNIRASTISQNNPRPHQPLTRLALAARRRSAQLGTPAINYSNAKALQEIKQFARQGGPDLSDVRGFPQPLTSSHQRMSSTRASSRAPRQSSKSTPKTKSSSHTTATKSTGPYDRNFQQKLIDGSVYPDGYEYPDGRVPPPPSNLDEINKMLMRSRASLSPSKFTDEDFRKFKRADTHAAKEKQVATSVFPIIEGYIGDAKCISGGIPFNNLDPLTDGTLTPGNPDIYYGARPEQLDRQVRDDLSGQIIPSTQDDLPILPNFMVAAKGPDGSAAVAKRQASYDGALGARAMHALQSYKQEPKCINNAYGITSTYHDGTLKMYTIHIGPSASQGGRPEYIMTQLKGWSMTGDIEMFRQGATAYRNGRDWTKKQRDVAITQANKRAGDCQSQTRTTDPTPELPSTDGTIMEQSVLISQESQGEPDEAASATADVRDCSTPPPELGPITQYAKRSNEQVKQLSPLRRKRQNLGEIIDEHIFQPETQSLEPSGLSQQFEEQILSQDLDDQSTETES